MPIPPIGSATEIKDAVGRLLPGETGSIDLGEVLIFFEVLTDQPPRTLAGFEYWSRRDTRSTRQLKNPKNLLADIGSAVQAVKHHVSRATGEHGGDRFKNDPAGILELENQRHRKPSIVRRPTDEMLAEIIRHVDYRNFLALLSGDSPQVAIHLRRTGQLKAKLLTTVDDKWHDRIRPPFELTRRLLDFAQQDPVHATAETSHQIDRIMSGEFDFLIPASRPPKRHKSNVTAELTSVLDFEVLPPGTDVRRLVEGLVRRRPLNAIGTVDPERVQVIVDIKDHFGAHHCRVARGRHSRPTVGHSHGGNVDEDYLVLVIQRLRRDGTMAEDAVAISPLANKNATYYVRHDVSQTSWRDVFSQPKREAQELGARRLVFKEGPDMTAYEAMRQKIIALSKCSSFEFRQELRYATTRGGATSRADASRTTCCLAVETIRRPV